MGGHYRVERKIISANLIKRLDNYRDIYFAYILKLACIVVKYQIIIKNLIFFGEKTWKAGSEIPVVL